MRQALTTLIVMTCLCLLAMNHADAQIPKSASVGFNNKTDLNIFIQGYTIVNGSKRYGPPLQLKKNGSMAFESSVPVGYRYYTICDANQPARVLLRDFQVPIKNREVSLDVVIQMPGNRIMIVPSQP
jgi:hypothetical protein